MKQAINKQESFQQGFSLIEVLIAMVIFAVGVMAVAQMQTHAQATNSRAFHQTEATMYASNQIESFVNMEYDDTDLDLNSDYDSSPILQAGKNNKYNIQWIVENGGNDRKVVTLKVTWSEKSGRKELYFEIIKSLKS